MFKNKNIVAIIPARSGSKRLPDKNMRILAGKPLIARTIESARESRFVDDVIVSTDSMRIAQASLKYGAKVPFMRPARLATDSADTIDVVLHSIGRLEAAAQKCDVVVLLQPTSPLRSATDIDEAIKALFKKRAGSIVSVCESEHCPLWSNVLPETGSMKDFLRQDVRTSRRMRRKVFYRLNGAIYLAFCDYLKDGKTFYGERSFAYIMPRERSVDVDTAMDLDIAEFLDAKLKRNAYAKKY